MRSLIVLSIVVLALSGCKDDPVPAQTSPPPAASEATFTMISVPPASYDPSFVAESVGNLVASSLFEGLVVFPPDDGPVRPGMATSWSVSPDGTTYTFVMREGVTWSDGTPLGAKDFVGSFERKLKGPTAEEAFVIAGAEAYAKGAATRVAGLEVTAEGELVITLIHGDPSFLSLLAMGNMAPVPLHVVAAHGDAWTKPAHVVVNGPYTLAALTPGVQLVLKKNPTYHAAATVAVDQVILRLETDSETAYSLFASGQADYLPGLIPQARIAALVAAPTPAFHVDPYLCTYGLLVNTADPVLGSKPLRQAIDRAIDKDRLVAFVTKGGQQAAGHLVPPVFGAPLGYSSPQGSSYDPAAAKALLAASGHPGGVGIGAIELSYNVSKGNEAILSAVAADLAAVGITVELEAVEWGTLVERIQKGTFRLARYAVCGLPEPTSFLQAFETSGAEHMGGFSSPSFDELLAKVYAAPTQAARNDLVAEAEALLVDEVPFVPLYFYTRPYLLAPGVGGFATNPMDIHPFRYLTVP